MNGEIVAHAAERDNDNDLHEVVVVGVDIPFWSLVSLLVKYAFASIPAMLIVLAVLGVIFLVIGVLPVHLHLP